MNTIIITGATSGIGLELAKHYLDQSENLVLIGRRSLEDLDSAIFKEGNYLQLDLSKSGGSSILTEHLNKKGISRIDLLIHCAAIGKYQEVKEVCRNELKELIQINLKSPIKITHSLLPKLSRSSGKIVFISSVMSNMPCREFASYAASKAALDSFARSLRIELEGQCSVLVFQPGGTSTGMHQKAGVPAQTVEGYKLKSPRSVAEKIVEAISTDLNLGSDSLGNKLVAFAGRRIAGLLSVATK